MQEKLNLAESIKKTILYLDKVVENFPRSEYVLKNNIRKTSFKILELVYYANTLKTNERMLLQKKIVSKLKMLDFYFKISFKKKYINYKKYIKIGNFLLNITKQIYGWIKYETKR